MGIGLLTLGFVTNAQQLISLPTWPSGETAAYGRTRAGMIGVGAVSGLLFGGTNVGMQLIAYLRSLDLSHGLFVGVVTFVFLGLNGIRVGVAGLLGLYPSSLMLLAPVVAAVPAAVGVAVGERHRAITSERSRKVVVSALLTVIGIRLVDGELGLF